MNIELTPEQQAAIEKGVKAGNYDSPAAMIERALIVLDFFDQNARNSDTAYIAAKCATLLALTTSQRVSTLYTIQYTDKSISASQLTILFTNSQSRPGYHVFL